MIVKEAVKGNGRLCGGVFLDQAFIELMRRKVTPDVWDALPKDEVQRLLNGDWEHGIKKQFHGQQKDWIVTLPPGCRHINGNSSFLRKQTLILNYADLDPMFRKTATNVAELVKEQIQHVGLKYGKLPKVKNRPRLIRSFLLTLESTSFLWGVSVVVYIFTIILSKKLPLEKWRSYRRKAPGREY